MKNAITAFATFCLLVTASFTAEKPAPNPQKVTLTFYVSGVECPSCIYSVWQAIHSIKGVTDVDAQQRIDSFANVTFDPGIVSAHQVAQAVADAWPLHGKPYVATLTLRVPDYAKAGNAPRLDAVLAGQRQWVRFEPVDKARGEFAVFFLPLKTEQKKAGPQGWNPDRLMGAVHDPAPKGLGLALEFERAE